MFVDVKDFKQVLSQNILLCRFCSADFDSTLGMLLNGISSDVEEFIQLLEKNIDGQLSHNTHINTLVRFQSNHYHLHTTNSTDDTLVRQKQVKCYICMFHIVAFSPKLEVNTQSPNNCPMGKYSQDDTAFTVTFQKHQDIEIMLCVI